MRQSKFTLLLGGRMTSRLRHYYRPALSINTQVVLQNNRGVKEAIKDDSPASDASRGRLLSTSFVSPLLWGPFRELPTSCSLSCLGSDYDYPCLPAGWVGIVLSLDSHLLHYAIYIERFMITSYIRATNKTTFQPTMDSY
jgi:hypothetical protein